MFSAAQMHLVESGDEVRSIEGFAAFSPVSAAPRHMDVFTTQPLSLSFAPRTLPPVEFDADGFPAGATQIEEKDASTTIQDTNNFLLAQPDSLDFQGLQSTFFK